MGVDSAMLCPAMVDLTLGVREFGGDDTTTARYALDLLTIYIVCAHGPSRPAGSQAIPEHGGLPPTQ